MREDLGDCVVAEGVAHQVHGLFLDACHQRVLQLLVSGLLNQNLDHTEAVAIDAKLHEIFLDFTQRKIGVLV